MPLCGGYRDTRFRYNWQAGALQGNRVACLPFSTTTGCSPRAAADYGREKRIVADAAVKTPTI